LVALAEVTWLASAEVARRVWAEITMAMEDVVSAALMTTAAVRITRHTTGPTTAPTEWVIRFGSCRRAAFEISRGSPGELANRGTLALRGEPPPHLTRHHSRNRGPTNVRWSCTRRRGPPLTLDASSARRARHKSLPIASDNVFIDGCMNQARVSTRRCAFPGDRDSKTARKQGFDKKNQERSAYRPQSEDRHRGADISASRHRVQAVRHSEATNQWRQPRWRCVSSCDVLDLLGYVLVAVF
jgi:hypothetical protein